MKKEVIINDKVLLKLAQNSSQIWLEEWAQIVQATAGEAAYANAKYREVANSRYYMNLTVKSAVSVIAFIGILAAPSAPAVLFAGGASILLNSLVNSSIKLADHSVSVDINPQFELEHAEQASWERHRSLYIHQSKQKGFNLAAERVKTNFKRVGFAVVSAFASYVAVVSGLGVAATIGSVFFSGALFHDNSDDAEQAKVNLSLPPSAVPSAANK